MTKTSLSLAAILLAATPAAAGTITADNPLAVTASTIRVIGGDPASPGVPRSVPEFIVFPITPTGDVQPHQFDVDLTVILPEPSGFVLATLALLALCGQCLDREKRRLRCRIWK